MFAIIASLALAQTAAASASPPASEADNSAPQPCATAAHAQFDFWLGEWEVTANGSDQVIARSRIERLHNGCAVREHWQPNSPAGGSSLNSLDPATGRWHQTWVGSGGETVHFEGGLAGSAMVLAGYWTGIGGPGKDGLVRMTYTPGADGSVRQYGQVSYDHGLTWDDSFDLIYRHPAS